MDLKLDKKLNGAISERPVRPKRDREVSGVLLLNKSRGVSSNSSLQTARTIFLAKKGGHTGNLDPLAEGVLPVCFGESTKFSQFLLDADKSYRVKIKLGITTDSGDADGNVVSEQCVPVYSFNRIEAVVQQLIGDVRQTPPMYSAIKYKGKPLYKYARAGIEIPRKSRTVKIYSIDILAWMQDELILDVKCSKGTYIRNLAEYIGNKLGCGGHVTELLRLSVGPFTLENSISVDKLEVIAAGSTNLSNITHRFTSLDNLLLPTSDLLYQLPKVELCDISAHYITQGNPVFIAKVLNHPGTLIALFVKKTGVLLGVGKVLDDGKIAPKRLIKLGQPPVLC